MGATSQGLPFPIATDPVSQGAAAIEALARAVDAIVLQSVPTEMRMGRVAMQGGGTSSMVSSFTYSTDELPAGAVVYAFAQVVSGSGASKAIVTVNPNAAGPTKILEVHAYLADGTVWPANPNLIVNVFLMIVRAGTQQLGTF